MATEGGVVCLCVCVWGGGGGVALLRYDAFLSSIHLYFSKGAIIIEKTMDTRLGILCTGLDSTQTTVLVIKIVS